MTRPQGPAIIMIGHPDLPKGPSRARCQKCLELFPIMESTAKTIADLGDKRKPLIACYGCLMAVLDTHPELAKAMPGFVGNKQARTRLGLDK